MFLFKGSEMFGFVGSLNWRWGFKDAVFVTWDCFIFGESFDLLGVWCNGFI